MQVACKYINVTGENRPLIDSDVLGGAGGFKFWLIEGRALKRDDHYFLAVGANVPGFSAQGKSMGEYIRVFSFNNTLLAG